MPEKHEFLFILPDGPDGLKNRDSWTDPHERFVEQESEYWLAGGPMYDSHEENIERGSWVLVHAYDKKEALDLLQRDPFTVGKVWDWEKAQVISMKSGLRVPFVKNSIKFPQEKMNGGS
ncbi:hypothetical protein BDW69DRAFT_175763 [Aspergillus filifer]